MIKKEGSKKVRKKFKPIRKNYFDKNKEKESALFKNGKKYLYFL